MFFHVIPCNSLHFSRRKSILLVSQDDSQDDSMRMMLDLASSADFELEKGEGQDKGRVGRGLAQLRALAATTKSMCDQFQTLADELLTECHEKDAKQIGLKAKTANDLESAADNLGPLLKKQRLVHIGLGKGQYLNVSEIVNERHIPDVLLQKSLVGDVHREVEAARNTIMQDMTIRRMLRLQIQETKKRANRTE